MLVAELLTSRTKMSNHKVGFEEQKGTDYIPAEGPALPVPHSERIIHPHAQPGWINHWEGSPRNIPTSNVGSLAVPFPMNDVASVCLG